MKCLPKPFLSLIILTYSFAIYAQSPRFDSYKILKNRKSVDVTDIFQDNKGYIWLGTNYGIVKYDGVNFQLFTDKNGLYDNNISTINQDNEGVIWIGHKSGKISQLIGNEFIKFDPEEGLSIEEISSFFIDLNNVLWFSTYGEGIYFYSGENRKRLYNINSDNGLLDNYVYDIVQDADSNMYFATDKGISVYSPKYNEFFEDITMSDGLPDNIVKDLFLIGNDLWIAMEDGGICKYNIKNREFSQATSWEFGPINNFIFINESELWVSTTRKGIVKINYDKDGNTWYTLYNKNNNLGDTRTRIILNDRENNIWIGTRNGLSVRKNNSFEFLNEKAGFNIKNIFSLVIDNLGNYWIASQEGLYIVSKDKMGKLNQKLLFKDPKNPYSFISLYKDISGNIWAGTYGYGVFKINPITLEITHYNTEKGLANDNIIHISGNDQDIWLSTLGGGVTRYCVSNSDRFMNYTTENGLTSDYVYSTYTDSQDRTWIATDGGGVVYFKKDSIHQFSNPKLDSINKTVYSVIEDCNLNLWFNCSDHGLYRYDGNKFDNFNEENGLKNNFLQGLTTDIMGNPVIISNEGIDKYIVKDSTFEYNGEAVGVAYLEPNLNAIYKDGTGNIWIGTANGIIKINSELDSSLEVLPKIFITGKSIYFEPIAEGRKVFKYNEKHLTFNYTALWYSSSEELNYRYKLEGYDIDWNAATSLRMVTYSNVPPGEYKFMVQVNYSGGKWLGSQDSEFEFRIKKPFWETWWFITISAILIVVVILLYIKARLQKLQRDKEILEEEVRKRTAEIRHQKEEIEAQRDEIEAQRNHVIEQRDKIEQQNKNITSSIEYASRIQRAVLPPKELFKKYLGEHFIFFRPRDIVSGDFYYLNLKNGQIIVAAADCTGHGVPGALMSILGISLMNKVITELPDNFNASNILTMLRKEVKNALGQTGKDNEAKDGMDISLCVINRDKKQLQYAGAYNPLILVRNNELVKYEADRMPIGIYIKEKDAFTNHIVDLKAGDFLYMFSDGYQDQFGGELKKKFLPKNLNNLLLEISNRSINEQLQVLDDTLENWKGDLQQVDDIIMLGIKI